jgi:hypothetical protein
MAWITGKVDRGVPKVKILAFDGKKVGGATMPLKNYAEKKSAGAEDSKRIN